MPKYGKYLWQIVQEAAQILDKTIFAPKHQTYENLLKDCRIGLSTVVIKKKILKSNFRFSKLTTKEDLFLWIQLSY